MHRHTEKRQSMMWCQSYELHYHATSLQELGALLQFLEFLATDNYIVFWPMHDATPFRLQWGFAWWNIILELLAVFPNITNHTLHDSVLFCDSPLRMTVLKLTLFPRIATDLLCFYRRVGVRPVHRLAIDRTSETTQLYTCIRIFAC